MATFTWHGTSGTTGWETNGANGWNGSPNYAGTDSFEVDGTYTFTINAIGGVTSDNADTVTVNDPNATLSMSTQNQPQFNIDTALVLNAGTLNLGVNGAIFLGNLAAGTIALGSNAVITDTGGASTDVFVSNNGPSTAITGSGTVLANQGTLDIQSGVTVAGADTTTFEIGSGGVLEFDDQVNGGSVAFLSNSGLLYLTAGQIGNGVNLSNGTFAASISGLTEGNSLTDGINISASTSIVSAALSGTNNDILKVTDQSGDTYTFNLIGNYTGASAHVTTDPNLGGFDVFLVCYCAGTHILTESGEVPVEHIKPGDVVMTQVEGVLESKQVVWAGHRDLDLTRHPAPRTVAPIRIMRGALAEGLPHRDLLVSPDHCLYIDGGLYPAKLLVNGMTIIRDLSVTKVSYHHLELARHEVLIAEGVAAESYLDTGNRAFFGNAGVTAILHPELGINEHHRSWETDACGRLMVKPEAVRPVWQNFADRAVGLGYAAPSHATTEDAGIHLMVDGKAIKPGAAGGRSVSFILPGSAQSVRLISRVMCPSTLTPWLDDPRDLGIAVRWIALRDRTGETVIGADHPALQTGWHATEYDPVGDFWRWTAGDAVLPIKVSGPCVVEITLGAPNTYIDDGVNQERLAA